VIDNLSTRFLRLVDACGGLRVSRAQSAACLVIVGALFCFLWIERLPLFEWDEARHAVNAWEMLHSRDWFNYTFGGVPDRWNAKPQLLVWLIVAGYEVIGPRELAVRWPSAVAAFGLGLIGYRMLRLFFTRELALVGALAFFTMRGLVGYHAGRTGDMDALFVFFLTASAYLALVCHRREGGRALAYAAAGGLALGGAFLAKGFAVGLAVPCFAVLFARRSWCEAATGTAPRVMACVRDILSRPTHWIFALAAAVFPGAWMASQAAFGHVHPDVAFAGRSQIGTMIAYDVLARVRGGVEGREAAYDPWYLLRQLDVLASPWGYLLIVALACALVWKLLRRNLARSDALAIAACFLLPMGALLMLMRHKLPWYAAPLLPFVALAVVAFLSALHQWRPRTATLLIVAVSCLALARQVRNISRSGDEHARVFFNAHAETLRSAGGVVAEDPLTQDEMAYLSWVRSDARFLHQGGPDAAAQRRSLVVVCANDALCAVRRALK
jgi:4-amino-4-deoxy-L-arabinose transferase-like glycosyltransferase